VLVSNLDGLLPDPAGDAPPTTPSAPPGPVGSVDRWVLEFVPLPSEIPAEVRVRALLKRALRDWKLKCVRITGGEAEAESDAHE
jgi:hypothetical protein